jgi:hypothetical protein
MTKIALMAPALLATSRKVLQSQNYVGLDRE